MSEPVSRFSAEALLSPDRSARVMLPRLSTVDVHWHDYYELGLVLSGEAVHVVNGESAVLRAGSAFLLSPADFHEIRVPGPEPLSCYNIVIDPAAMERHLGALGPVAVDGFPWRTDEFGDAEPDLRRLHGELDGTRVGSARMVDALVSCLIIELARRCGLEQLRDLRPLAADDNLRGAVLYVDRHFREPLTLADAAAQAHLSANYFSERFRDYTGTSFQAYLQERRLRFARSLLASTSLTVSEVCHAAGFNDLSHFGRAFRRRYAAAPSSRPSAGPVDDGLGVTQTTRIG
jgi:AraC-like DNA-binding protein/mannose-6-phosphate isomerase-like protein (cupin superfamily)